jgi:hypothetical protein
LPWRYYYSVKISAQNSYYFNEKSIFLNKKEILTGWSHLNGKQESLMKINKNKNSKLEKLQ